jgi:hypothetical protein
MTYTVKPGDTLSQILKNFGVSSYSSPSTWALVSTRSGDPGRIFSGETLDLSRAMGYQSTGGSGGSGGSSGSSTSTTISGDLAGKAAAELGPTKDAFHKRFGTLEENMPLAALEQFAEQQVNPDAFRNAVNQMSNLERGFSTSGSWRTGYAQSERERTLADLERQRKEMVSQYIDPQKELFKNWYGAEMENYMTSKDPSNYVLDRSGLGGTFDDLGWTNDPSKPQNVYTYNPIDMRNYFRNQGVSGYRPAPLNNLWGTIT